MSLLPAMWGQCQSYWDFNVFLLLSLYQNLTKTARIIIHTWVSFTKYNHVCDQVLRVLIYIIACKSWKQP